MRWIIVTGAVLCMAFGEGWARPDEDQWTRFMVEGLAQEKKGNYPAAAASYQEAVRLVERTGDTNARLALGLNSLARADDELGLFTEAERQYRRALTVLERIGERDRPSYAVLLGNLGSLLVENGHTAAGVNLLRESHAMHVRLMPPDDKRIAAVCNGLAEALLATGKYREAEQRLNEASVILEGNSQDSRSQLAITLSNLALVKREQGRHAEALNMLERSLALFERDLGPDHPLLVRGLNNLAVEYSAARRRDEAGAAFERALALSEKYLGSKHPIYGAVLLNYAAHLRANGRKADAKTMEAQSKSVLMDSARRNGLGMTVDASTLRAK